MIKMYKEEIEKTAARAWKKVLGTLSEDGVKRLTDSGVFNRNKELSGLWRGTNNILKSQNAKNIKDHGKFVSSVVKPSSKMFNMEFNQDPEAYRELRNQLSSIGMSGSIYGQLGKNKGGLTHVPSHATSKLNDTANKLKSQYESFGVPFDFKKIPRKDREAKKWSDAILARHEADEIRFGNSAAKNKRTSAVIQGNRVPVTNFASHLSPKVLEAESANVAMAPKATQNMLKSVRGINGSGSEISSFKNFGGSNYGSSAVFNKRNGRRVEKETARQTKRLYEMQGII